MKRSLLFSLLIPMILLSCRKKDQPGNSSTSTGSGTSITSSSATSWYAFFNEDKFIEISPSNTTTYNMTRVNFYKSPSLYLDVNFMMVDSVILNGTPLQFWAFDDSTYIDTSGLNSGMLHALSYPYTFKVAGRGPIPSFSYTRNGPFPAYTDYASLPDTLFRNLGYALNMQTMANADEIQVTIHGGSGKEVNKAVYPPYPNKLLFTSAELLQLDTTSFSTIEIMLGKIDNLNVNGKPMLFGDGLNVTKHIVVR